MLGQQRIDAPATRALRSRIEERKEVGFPTQHLIVLFDVATSAADPVKVLGKCG